MRRCATCDSYWPNRSCPNCRESEYEQRERERMDMLDADNARDAALCQEFDEEHEPEETE